MNSVIAQSMSWDEIETLIDQETQAGNPVASILILDLKLYLSVFKASFIP